MSIKNIISGLIIAIIIFFGGYFARGKRIVERVTNVTDTVTIVKIDTLTITDTKYITRTLLDTIRVPFYDTLYSNDTICLELPREQKRYVQRGVYDAWVSGYSPTLDSIQVYPKVTTKIITVKERGSKFGVGLLGGVSVGSERGLYPFFGIGVYYQLFEIK